MALLVGTPCGGARSFVFGAALALLLAPATAHPQAARATGTEPNIRLIRSTSGSRGTLQGSRYVVEDPRGVFSAAEDRHVVVHFEWEGRPGTYHCEGRWKDPTGRVVLVAPIEYQATARRFGIYWTLALPETAAPGLWALEAFLDGHAAGTHSFEMTASAVPAPAPHLSTGEIYRRALASVATVEALGGAGEMLGQGPALSLEGDHVVAAFPSIEGASAVRLRTAQGTIAETREIGEWDRRLGWAVIPFPRHGLPPLPRAAVPPAVGDRFFVLHSAEDGSRVIAEASVVGQEQSTSGRSRLNSGFAAGSPVLDERGDLVGIVVGSPGEETLGPLVQGYSSPTAIVSGSLLVPAARLPASPTARVSLAELASRGEFLRPLGPGKRHVISGVFAARVERGGVVPMPQDQRFVFSRREGQVSVFVQWSPQEKMDVLTRFEIYDSDYRTVGRGEPKKLKLRRGDYFFSTWTFPIDRMPASVYRFDLFLGDAPAWRGYLRITE